VPDGVTELDEVLDGVIVFVEVLVTVPVGVIDDVIVEDSVAPDDSDEYNDKEYTELLDPEYDTILLIV